MTASDTKPSTTRPVQERLMDAAEQCLRTNGIRATTVSEVAELAGVSRGWLYRHFPDKSSLLGAAIVRLNDAYWGEAHAVLTEFDNLVEQIATAIQLGRSAYDSPGALVMKLRLDEPEEFNACAGAGVQGLIPDLAAFWKPYVTAAAERGEINPGTNETDLDEAIEWVARAILSLATVPGERLDVDDKSALIEHLNRFLLPVLR